DAQMRRTATRPVPSGRISPRAALIYGLVLEVLSFALLAGAVNLLAAVLALAGFLGYVFVYTIWLKRRAPQNIVIGGAAGAGPPLVGLAGAARGPPAPPPMSASRLRLLAAPHALLGSDIVNGPRLGAWGPALKPFR